MKLITDINEFKVGDKFVGVFRDGVKTKGKVMEITDGFIIFKHHNIGDKYANEKDITEKVNKTTPYIKANWKLYVYKTKKELDDIMLVMDL